MPSRGADRETGVGPPNITPALKNLRLFSATCTGRVSLGAGPQTPGIFRFPANGTVGYAARTATEARAPVGTDPSAVAAPYGTGGTPRGVACFSFAVGPKAANPRVVARSSGSSSIYGTNASPGGFPIVLTADRVLMAGYAVLLDGMVAAAQTTRIPGVVMRRLVAPPMPRRDGRAVRAPLGLRRVEAALIRDGFDPADVAVVRPEDLHRAIGPATRLVGVSSGDPLGLGMNDATVEGIAGGEVYTGRWFRRLMTRLRRLRQTHPFTLLVGGPGAWQLVQHPDARRDLGIDIVFTGYAERDIADLARRVLDRKNGADPLRQRGLPPSCETVAGRWVEPAAIPPIRAPSSMGAVEITRGCGRGCRFCTLAEAPEEHLPVEAVVADVETNVRGGVASACLLSEDFFRYGGTGATVNPDALINLVRAVRRVDGLRLIQIDHASIAAVSQFEPAALRAVHDALTAGVRDEDVWVNVGVESASGELVAATCGRAKMHPIRPDDWEAASEEVVHRLIDAGFVPMISLVLGLPGEQPADIERTLRFVDRLRGRRALVFPIFYAPVRPDERGFRVADLTPAHWRLVRRSYAFTLRWMPGVHWASRRAAGASLARTLLLQAGGRGQTWLWRLLFVIRSRRLRA